MKQTIKKRLIHRLKILEGQMRGLQRMVEDDVYCIKVLHQSAAAREALSGIEDFILEDHLSTCVIAQIRSGRSDKPVREVMEVYRLSKHR